MIKDIESKNEDLTACHKQISILKKHFPSCFKADGSFDIERFKEEINENVNITKEGYELKFLGKSYAKLLASLDTTTIISPNKEHNELPENKDSKNMYISGDNLDGLKHLLKSYANSVKCIYIDPPYNTGSDGFVYNDSFNFTAEELEHRLSIDQDEAERILNITKSNSASHSAWLTFMYPRLQLAKDLLTDDGVIFISIDDNEVAQLRLLCDDVFGEENFVNTFCYINNLKGRQISNTGASKTYEFILCYSKNIEYINNFEIDIEYLKQIMPNAYKGFDYKKLKDENGEYVIKNELYNTNKMFNEKTRPNLVFNIHYNEHFKKVKFTEYNESKTFEGYEKIEAIKNDDNTFKAWRWSKDKIERELDNLEFIKQKNGNYKIFTKIRNFEKTILKDILLGIKSNGNKEVEELFNKRVFSYPKTYNLIKTFIKCMLIKNNDIILDFFSGSGTTADAVMQLNAEDGGSRKYILVQIPELIKQERNKATYDFLNSINRPTTLDYIGIERIIRASAKIKEETKADIDYGFKHFALKEANQNTLDKCESFDKNALLPDKTILDDFGIDTVLTTWLNYDGYGLNAEYEEVDLKGYTAYYCNKHLYLINSGFDQDKVMALFELYESKSDFNVENIILFGYSFNQWSVTETLENNLKILNDSEKNLKVNISVRY